MATSGNTNRSFFSILLAEDNPINQKVAMRVLKHLDYLADMVGNGKEVIEAIANKSYDLILMDIQMPEMDGFEFSRLLRERSEWRSIPVIVITAKDITADDRRRLNGNVQHVLAKGYNRAELLQQVRDLLDNSLARTGITQPAPKPGV